MYQLTIAVVFVALVTCTECVVLSRVKRTIYPPGIKIFPNSREFPDGNDEYKFFNKIWKNRGFAKDAKDQAERNYAKYNGNAGRRKFFSMEYRKYGENPGNTEDIGYTKFLKRTKQVLEEREDLTPGQKNNFLKEIDNIIDERIKRSDKFGGEDEGHGHVREEWENMRDDLKTEWKTELDEFEIKKNLEAEGGKIKETEGNEETQREDLKEKFEKGKEVAEEDTRKREEKENQEEIKRKKAEGRQRQRDQKKEAENRNKEIERKKKRNQEEKKKREKEEKEREKGEEREKNAEKEKRKNIEGEEEKERGELKKKSEEGEKKAEEKRRKREDDEKEKNNAEQKKEAKEGKKKEGEEQKEGDGLNNNEEKEEVQAEIDDIEESGSEGGWWETIQGYTEQLKNILRKLFSKGETESGVEAEAAADGGWGKWISNMFRKKGIDDEEMKDMKTTNTDNGGAGADVDKTVGDDIITDLEDGVTGNDGADVAGNEIAGAAEIEAAGLETAAEEAAEVAIFL